MEVFEIVQKWMSRRAARRAVQTVWDFVMNFYETMHLAISHTSVSAFVASLPANLRILQPRRIALNPM